MSVPIGASDKAAPVGGPGAPAPILTMAVAKKLLPRAIDRNRFRRIVREAWRAGPRDQVLGVGVSAGVDHAPAGTRSAVPEKERKLRRTVFVRLMKTQPAWKGLCDGPLKRLWREEIDRLFAELSARLQRERQ